MNSRLDRLWKKFARKTYRDAFVESHLATNIAAQIVTLREDRGLSQQELADAAEMKQSRICVLENPSNQSLSIRTLKRIAAAFDVALVVRFVKFSELARWASSSSETKFSVPSFRDDGIDAQFPIVVRRAVQSSVATRFNSSVNESADIGLTFKIPPFGNPAPTAQASMNTVH